MAKRTRTKSKGPQSGIRDFLNFVEEKADRPLETDDELHLFALDSIAGRECKTAHIEVPNLGAGTKTPAMNLNYYRESLYKYPGALTGPPQIPPGEIECYRICLDVQDDWMLWLRAVAGMIKVRPKVRTDKKRADRLADIQRLIKVVTRLLRESVDHAAETWDRTGEPEVLPRRDQKLIGAEIDLSETTTSRRFTDPDADQLRAHWDMLLDRDRIVAIAEGRRKQNAR